VKPHTWHVFTMDYYISAHRSYAEAVHEAQCHLDTNNRPKRLHAGYYELFGEEQQRDIATTEAAAIQDFLWAKRLLNNQCPECGIPVSPRFPVHDCKPEAA
jgi:hypothetical protein